jgi:hypothetical protein
MNRVPLRWRESRVIGARPARLAARLCSMTPSLDEHGGCRGFADTGDAHEDIEAGVQERIGNFGMQVGVDRGDLAIDLQEALPGLTLEQRRAVHVIAVMGADPVLDQGAAGDMQLIHRIQGRAHTVRMGGSSGAAKRRAWRGLTLTSGRPAAASRPSKAW